MSETEQGPERGRNAPCIVCGGAVFEWGYLTGRNDLWFRAGQHPGFSGVAFFTQGYEQCQARKCTTCGNVLLFAQSQ